MPAEAPPGLAPLLTLTALLEPPQALGLTPEGERKIVMVRGGTVEGERVRGEVLPGGGDWARTRPDGVLELDVRLTLRTHDGALVFMRYSGLRHGAPADIDALARGERVDPARLYFRIAPRFETGDARYAFLNRILAIGTGERLPEGPRYRVFEVL